MLLIAYSRPILRDLTVPISFGQIYVRRGTM